MPDETTEPQIHYIEQPFQRVTVGDDDILVVNIPVGFSQACLENMRKNLFEAFGPRKIVLLEGDARIGAIAKEDAR